MTTPTVQADFRFPASLDARYRKLAEQTGRSRSWFLNAALASAIDELEFEFGVLKQVEDLRAGRLETYSLDEVKEHLGL